MGDLLEVLVLHPSFLRRILYNRATREFRWRDIFFTAPRAYHAFGVIVKRWNACGKVPPRIVK